ncbi:MULTISPECIES: response regulator [unclassified Pseudomonas]|uniref:response regulator n=1 Tax=unclassified Pseudomonas TaxID=196821 RepID=UPI0035C11E16
MSLVATGSSSPLRGLLDLLLETAWRHPCAVALLGLLLMMLHGARQLRMSKVREVMLLGQVSALSGVIAGLRRQRQARVGHAQLPACRRNQGHLPSVEHCLRVLLVGGHPANRLLLRLQLQRLGHCAELAEGGSQALRASMNRPFDVIISDCEMPNMNGYQLARAVRQHEQRQQASPCLVVGLAARELVRTRMRCLAAGMDDCLRYPLPMVQLRRLLGLAATRGDDTIEFDLGELKRLTAGDSQAVCSLLRDLQEVNRNDVRRLRECLQRGDLAGLAALAHRIKGGVRIIRAQRVVDACQRLEDRCAVASEICDDIALDLKLLILAVLRLEVRLRRYRAGCDA